jgi:type IV secretion system protein VirD4
MSAHRTSTGPGPGFAADPGEYLILAAVAGLLVLSVGVWLTGELAGLLSTGHWPSVSFTTAVTTAMRLPAHLSDPRLAWPPAIQRDLPGVAGFGVAGLVVVVVLGGAGFVVMRVIGRWAAPRGYATASQLRQTLSERAVVRRGRVVRPDLAGHTVAVTDAGARLGRSVPAGIKLAVSAEDSAIVLAAPRTGKTSQVIIPWLHTWPGPALVTSIRPDVLLATAVPRSARGPVLVMAPTGMIEWPEVLTWDPAARCESFDRARARADVMVTVGKSSATSDSNDGGFFGQNATNLLAGWLHAAALSGGGMRDVLRWAFDERLDEPIRVLASHEAAADGTAAMLDSLYRLPADTTRSSLWATAQTAIAPLLAPAARDIFTPAPGTATDLAAFLRDGGTCYLLADERRAAGLAPVVSAFADDLIETAKSLADAAPGGRLDPPMGMFLDEVANIVPLPQLPALMSFAGGTGIFVTAVLQSLAQARDRWGIEPAAMLWGAATVKIILAGLAGSDLRDVSDLAGEYRETLLSWQRGPGGASVSTSLQDRRTIAPDQVRTLAVARREALVIHATAPAVRVRMTRHYEGPHRREFAESVRIARGIAGLDSSLRSVTTRRVSIHEREPDPSG